MDTRHGSGWHYTGSRLLLVGLLVGVNGIGAVGCTKKAKKMRCRYAAADLKQLRQQGDDPILTEMQRTAQVAKMFKLCRPFMPALRSMIMLHHGMDGAMELKVSKKDQRALDRRLEKLCPGIIKRMETMSGPSPAARGKMVAGKCRVDRFKVMSHQELMMDALMNLFVIITYQELRAGGLDHRAARALARSSMARGHLNIVSKEGEMLLPKSNARTVAQNTTQLLLSASTVLIDNKAVVNVKNGRIDANSKRDGPDGFFITPVHKQLKQRLAQNKSRGAAAGRLPADHLLLAAHKGTPWRPASALIYSAVQAGYRHFGLVVDGNSIWHRTILFEAVSSAGTPALEPRVRFGQRHLTLLLGGSSPPKRFKFSQGKRTPSIKALGAYLHKRAILLKRAGKWGVVHIEVDPTAKFEWVVQLLDVLRLKQGSKPDSCHFAFDAKARRWTLPAASKSGCLMPYPKIYVGPAGLRKPPTPASPAKKPPMSAAMRPAAGR